MQDLIEPDTPSGNVTQRIRVAVVDDHEMVAEGLAAALAAQPDMAVVAVRGTVAAAVDLAGHAPPDVYAMDFRLPDGTGADATAQIRAVDPEAIVLLVTADDTPAVVARAVEAGCAGLVVKAASVRNVIAAVRTVHAGGSAFAPALLAQAAHLLRDQRYGELSDRELEVLRLLGTGASTTAIAEQLVLSTHTVRNHVRHINDKLGASSKLEAVVIAVKLGFIQVGETP